MAAETAADRASFFGSDDFAVLATYTSATGARAVLGIFDKPALEVQIGEIVQSLDSRPTFTCQAADLPGDAKGGDAGDTLLIDITTYRVTELKPDGTGLIVLVLGR